MKYVLSILFFIQSYVLFGQSYFNQTFDTDGYQEIGNGIIVEDSTYLINCLGEYQNVPHMTFLRLNQFGDSILLTHYGDTNTPIIGGTNHALIKKDNYYYQTGGIGNYDSAKSDIMLTKVDPYTLDTIWLLNYSFENSEYARSLVETSDSGFLFGGYTQPYDGSNYGDARWFTIKTNGQGNEAWRRDDYGIIGDLTGIVATNDDNYVLVGWDVNGNARLVKIDESGNVLWNKIIGKNSKSLGFMGVIELPDSSLMGYGEQILLPDYIRQHFLAKMTKDGDTLWTKTYGGLPNSNAIRNLELLPDGSFIACGQGSSQGTSSTNVRGTILKFCPNGELLWERKYGALDFNSYLYDIELTNDGGFIATGSTKGTSGTQDLWVIKVDSLGCDTPGCAVAPEPCPIDTTIGINEKELLSIGLKVYPNPFTQQIAIKWNVTQSGGTAETKSLNITIFDILGKQILQKQIPRSFLTLNDEFIIDGSKLQKGIYILEVEGVGRTKIVKE